MDDAVVLNEGQKPVTENDIENEVNLSRDMFLASFRNFQSDLYREELTPEKVEEALRKIRIKSNLLGNVPISQFLVTTVRYRKEGDIERALKLFYQSANRLKLPVLYVLKKEACVVTLSLGVVNPNATTKDKKAVFNDNAGSMPNVLLGFLPGTECKPVATSELLTATKVGNYTHRRVVIGVPGKRTDANEKAKKQGQEEQPSEGFGIERVVDSVEDDFIVVGISVPVENAVVNESQAVFSAAHDFFQILAKHTEQVSKSFAEGKNWSKQRGTSRQDSEEGTNTTLHYGDAVGTSLKKMLKRWWGSEGWFRGEDSQTSRKEVSINKPGVVKGTNESQTDGGSITETNQRGVTIERTNELAKLTAELIEKQLKRFERGLASGMWRHSTQVLAKKSLTANRVADILCGYLGGDDVAVSQMRSIRLPDEHQNSLPVLDLGLRQIPCVESALGSEYSGVSTLITTDELTKICALPLHDIPGIVVEKLTDFGRNLSPNAETQSVKIGDVIDHECETKQEVRIGYEQLKRHMFVTGATGAGKSTTMRQLLLNLYNPQGDNHIPFLVIEPVKREYRELKKWIKDLQVITLGAEDCSYGLSPFAVEPELGLVPHIDNLKAAFNASMGNYSSMPFILEDIIYKAYEECGWDLSTGKNPIADKLEKAGKLAHVVPVMEGLLPFVEKSIRDFFGDKQSDYGNSLFGALRARISSMTRGAKGNVLNKLCNAVDMATLLKKPCVIELWPFTDNEEKAFIMALIMIKLYEYRQKVDILDKGKIDHPLEHVLVIEEAHRLLAKQQSAGEHSSSGRQKAVEFFADILAEIRSYGQGIVIVDQIPSKLIPDVLKNTDVKVAHRLADKEDREVLGGTMNLTKEQIDEVARLRPGAGVVYYSGLRQAVKIKVPLESNVEKEIKEHEGAKKFHV